MPTSEAEIRRKEQKRAKDFRYNHSEKGRARRRKYNRSAKGHVVNNRYEQSDKGRTRQAIFRCNHTQITAEKLWRLVLSGYN